MAEKSRGAGKRGKFVSLAERRTVNAIKAIRVIAKLGNKVSYDYTDADVKKIVSTLSQEIDSMKQKMTASEDKQTVKFKL